MPGRLELRECGQCGAEFGTRRSQQRFCSRRCARRQQARPPLPVARYDAAWMDRALCRDYDPELWFTEFRKDSAGHAKARSVCARCPVRADCLDYALAMGERHGVWGGVGPGDRAAIATVEAGAGVS